MTGRTEVEGRDAAEHVHEPALHVPRLLQALHDVRADDQDEAANKVDRGDADLHYVAQPVVSCLSTQPSLRRRHVPGACKMQPNRSVKLMLPRGVNL